MSEFKNTRWADEKFSKMYRDAADIYMPFRRQFFEVTKSLYSYYFSGIAETRFLDLGCGDGSFAEELLKNFSPAKVTLTDGSVDMLETAKKRLSNISNVEYIEAGFQTIVHSDILKGPFDFVFSSFAIHHLPFKEKKLLYSSIYDLLSQGGCFVHNDVIAPQSRRIEDWYLSIWREWIDRFPDKKKIEGMEVIPEKYRESPDDFPDPLETHIELLRETGFSDVDCYFKYGIFALFGGFKKSNDI